VSFLDAILNRAQYPRGIWDSESRSRPRIGEKHVSFSGLFPRILVGDRFGEFASCGGINILNRIEGLMFESLMNLPSVISGVWSARRGAKKRRQLQNRICRNLVEDLEARQLLSAANAAADSGFTPRIVAGTTTTDFEAVGELTFTPTVGAVIQSTGTLISDEWILTSATASKGLTETGGVATVVLGGVTYEVDSIVPYPKTTNGSGDFKQDIALWHLTEVVPSDITPLEYSYTAAKKKSTITMVGFGGGGTGSTGSDGIYGTKRTADNKIDRVSSSLLVWKFSGNSEGTSADGDRGGPVLQLVDGEYQIVGVASHHTTNDSKFKDTAFNTRVDVYAGWIDDTISKAHPTTSGSDDFVNDADLAGSSNKLITFTTKKRPVVISGKLETYGDADTFKFVIPDDGIMTIDLQNSSPSTILLDTVLELLDETGAVIDTSDDISANNLDSQLVSPLAAGTYYLRVSGYADAQIGTYRVTMRMKYTSIDPVDDTPPPAEADLSAIGQLTFTPTEGAAVFSTGALVDTQWILTAASASKGLTETGGTATVILGGVTYIVDNIEIYSKYSANSGGDYKQDLALWHITEAVPGTIAPLSIAATPAVAGKTVTLAGFGGTALVEGEVVYDTLQSGTNKVDRVSPATLVWKLEAAVELSTAAGDAGGAVLRAVGSTLEIVGIASPVSATTASAIGQFTYNLRTDLYLGWIEDTLERAHAVVSGADDFADEADTVGTSNKTFTFTTIKPTFEALGKLGTYGDVDVFKVIVAANGIMEFDLKSQSPTTQFLDTYLEILDSEGEVLLTSDDVGASDLGSHITTYLAAGTYFARVSGFANQQKGTYRLTMTDNFDNVDGDAEGAKILTPNSIGTITTEVVINEPLDVDYFTFTAGADGKYQFDFEKASNSDLDGEIEVFDADGNSLAFNDDFNAPNRNARVTVTGITEGSVYFVKLNGYLNSVGIGKLTIRRTGA
jgi:hypothetical protein